MRFLIDDPILIPEVSMIGCRGRYLCGYQIQLGQTYDFESNTRFVNLLLMHHS